MKLVCAGNLSQYYNWCDDHGIDGRDRAHVQYVAGVHRLFGLSLSKKTDEVIEVGTFHHRADAQNIRDTIDTRWCDDT